MIMNSALKEKDLILEECVTRKPISFLKPFLTLIFQPIYLQN